MVLPVLVTVPQQPVMVPPVLVALFQQPVMVLPVLVALPQQPVKVLPVLVTLPQQPVQLGRLLSDGLRHLVRVRHFTAHLPHKERQSVKRNETKKPA